ncbi:MAG: TolC family protein, partial [Gemmataceae bacterium]|nr:TolC family protein [Gemmataceae bacterium]
MRRVGLITRLCSYARRRRLFAVACGVPLALPACQIAKPRMADPLPPLPASFAGAASPDNSAQLRADEFFNDPVLTHLIAEALANNQQLKILAQDIQIAQNEVQLRRGRLFPFVAVRGGVGVDRHSRYTLLGAVEDQLEYVPGKHFPRGVPDFLVAANVSWQIDIWRKLRNARDAAALQYLATAEGRNYVVTRLTADIAENYYNLMALDSRLLVLDQTIDIQEKSLAAAQARLEFAKGTAVAVQRFQADIRRFQGEKQVVRQEIVETENRINFLLGRFPQPVERMSAGFLDLAPPRLSVGVPAQLLLNRPDVRQAEREVAAAGLEVKVARAEFFPSLDITGGLGFQALNPTYLFRPEAFIANAAGDLVAPLVNRTAIQAVYGTANARQLQAVYEYQRVILDAYTEVVNRLSGVQNYGRSLELRRQQAQSLDAAVGSATALFNQARGEYLEVLTAQRDLLEARTALIEVKRQQLAAVVNAYQALGGGGLSPAAAPAGPPAPPVVLPP